MKVSIVLIICLLIFGCGGQVVRELPVTLSTKKCGYEDLCAWLTFENFESRALCVLDFVFPHDGALGVDAFTIYDKNGDTLVPFKQMEPFIVVNDSAAALVRLVKPGAEMISEINLSEFYELQSDSSYTISYQARIYDCDNFNNDDRFFVLRGDAELVSEN